MLITKTYQPHITKFLIYITVPQIYDNIINVDVGGTFENGHSFSFQRIQANDNYITY